MGHSEMLLAVAGIEGSEIEARTRLLASGDWSSFPPEQAAAFRAAARLSRAPAAFTRADADELVAACGAARAADVVWLIAWGNYMTTVADTLELPLERDNVFARPADPK